MSSVFTLYEDLITKIAGELRRILSTYVPHPLRTRWIDVPFDTDDLTIKFPAPIEVRCHVVKADTLFNVYVYDPPIKFGSVNLEFASGHLSAVRLDRTLVGAGITSDSALASIFPYVLSHAEKAEISSAIGLAERWFRELVESARQVAETEEFKAFDASALLNNAMNTNMTVHTFYEREHAFSAYIYVSHSGYVEVFAKSEQNGSISASYREKPVGIWVANLDPDTVANILRIIAERGVQDVESCVKEFMDAYKLLVVALEYINV